LENQYNCTCNLFKHTLFQTFRYQLPNKAKKGKSAISKHQPPLEIRSLSINDAASIWKLVSESGTLDINSPYLYLLLCRDFSSTGFVATLRSEVVGFVTAYEQPDAPGVLFVWQIGVASEMRKKGIGLQLLHALTQASTAGRWTALEATISPSNHASRRLFETLARSHQSQLVEIPDAGFQPADFPDLEHECEPRFRIELAQSPLCGTLSEPKSSPSSTVLERPQGHGNF
jgi:L-2,4-diaminobutyric acid acetyltransferase